MVETAGKVNIFMLGKKRAASVGTICISAMLIQIYEIQTLQEAQLMVDIGVDHVGSVLVSSETWKHVELKKAIQRVQSLGCRSSLIPLFEDIDAICRAIDFYRPDIVHFCEALVPHGTELYGLDPVLGRQNTIRERYPGVDLMRSIPIGLPGFGNHVPSLSIAALFEPISDWFLTDTLLGGGCSHPAPDQPVQGYVGITGRRCDWRIARALVQQSNIPVILAGGIGPENVADGIAQVRPAGVDSCTLTNRVNGEGQVIRFQKDPDKVKALVENAHRAGLH
jgi:phosphoribosylanthranilate isomerase